MSTGKVSSSQFPRSIIYDIKRVIHPLSDATSDRICTLFTDIGMHMVDAQNAAKESSAEHQLVRYIKYLILNRNDIMLLERLIKDANDDADCGNVFMGIVAKSMQAILLYVNEIPQQ